MRRYMHVSIYAFAPKSDSELWRRETTTKGCTAYEVKGKFGKITLRVKPDLPESEINWPCTEIFLEEVLLFTDEPFITWGIPSEIHELVTELQQRLGG